MERYFFSLEELKFIPKHIKVLELTETLKRYPFLLNNPQVFSRFFHKDRSILEENRGFLNYLEDDKSKELYEQILKFRKTLNPSYLPSLGDEIQYFPENIFGKNLERLEKVETFIDLGAFVGDTAIFATEILKNLKNYFAFELDISNFSKLRNTLNLLKQRKKK